MMFIQYISTKVRPKLLLGLFFIFLYSGLANAQGTGPGGVGDATNMALWLDASELGLADQDNVSTWFDLSGNGNDLTASVGLEPSFNSSGSINGLPTVSFNGSSEYLEASSIGELSTDELSYFIVYQNQDNLPISGDNRYGMVLSTRSSNNVIEWAYQLKRQSGSSVKVERYALVSPGNQKIAVSDLNNTESLESNIGSGMWRNNDQIYGLFNGGKSASTAGATSSGWTHTDTQLGAARNASGTLVRYFQGEIAEVVIYGEELNSAQEKIIYNYLSAKYGITLLSLSIYTHGLTHPHDVGGIGRDDASNEHLSARGTGEVSFDIASLDNADYMIWGHDNAGYSLVDTDLPTSYSGTEGKRVSQEWRVTEVGDLSDNGDLTVEFDINGMEFGHEDDYQILINQDGDGDWSDADTITGSYSSGVVTFTVPAGSIVDGSRFTFASKQRIIVSILSGQNWNVSSTWSCNCVPDNNNNVQVSGGHIVTVSDLQSVNDLYVRSTGELIIDNGADFEITGDVDSDEDFTINQSSLITLNGTSAQILDFVGTVNFDDLTVDNSAGASFISGTFTFSGTFIPADGDVNFGANSVTFLSSALGTAAIGPQGSGTITMTNVISERFIEAGTANWTEVGFPFFADYDLTEWDDEIFMSGPTNFADGCASGPGGCFNSVTYWDAIAGVNVGIDDAEMPIAQGVGIDIFLGDNQTSWSAKTLRVDGRALNFTLDEVITLESGWNFIANPFLCPVDWDDLTRSGVDNYFWVYDAEEGWLFYDPDGAPITNSASVNMSNGIISAYQGLWVFSPGGGSITFSQSSKSPSSNDDFIKSSRGYNNQKLFTIALKNNGSEVAPARVYFNRSLEKSDLSYPKLPLKRDLVAISALDKTNQESSLITIDNSNCVRVPLIIDKISSGDTYTFSFENYESKLKSYIIDNFSGEYFEMDNTVELEFTLNGDDSNRFDVLFTKNGAACNASVDEEINLEVIPSLNSFMVQLEKPIDSYSVHVVDMMGKVIYQSSQITTNSLRSNHFKTLANGVYIVRVVNEQGRVLAAKKMMAVK